MRTIIALSFTLAASALGCLFAASALAAYPGANGPILFERAGKLYTVSPLGPVNSEHKLLKVGGPAETLEYSPNGKRIALAADLGAGNSWQIVVAKSNGKKPYVVTKKARRCLSARMPTWSPDGRKIAFVCNDKGFPVSNEVWTINADGTQPRAVTNVDEVDYVKWNPADPNEIAFVDSQLLYTVPASGGAPTLLNGDPPGITGAGWFDFDYSPDGSQLVVESGEGNLHLMDSTTGVFGPSLIGGIDAQLEPSFSPDGTSIVYVNSGSSVFDIHIAPVTGAAAGTPLTAGTASDRYPVFRPMP